MKVLFIGGTGIISSACTELAVSKGIELYHLNRGNSSAIRPVPRSVIQLTADIRNTEAVTDILNNLSFDVVVDWLSYNSEQLENSMKLFRNKTRQYLFISSASAYQTPPSQLPVTEETPLDNPFWLYSRNKMACENFLKENAAKYGMEYTIVRPSHTYDKTALPLRGGYTTLKRMLNGNPVMVMGDGTSIWTLTHHRDFAVGLVGLLGNIKAINNDFHITSDEWLSWDQIYRFVGHAFNVEPKLVHVPSEVIARFLPEVGNGLLGDKMHSMIFDNSKIKDAVPEFQCKIPFEEGVKEIATWYKSDLANCIADLDQDKITDSIIDMIVKIVP